MKKLEEKDEIADVNILDPMATGLTDSWNVCQTVINTPQTPRFQEDTILGILEHISEQILSLSSPNSLTNTSKNL